MAAAIAINVFLNVLWNEREISKTPIDLIDTKNLMNIGGVTYGKNLLSNKDFVSLVNTHVVREFRKAVQSCRNNVNIIIVL